MPMSTGTKRILAVVVIAVIVVAGVGVYLLITPSGPQYVTPGAPSGISSSQVIKVGVLDDFTDATGIGAWNGAYLRAFEINSAGGVVVNGTHYYFGLIREDTAEAQAALDISKGKSAAEKLISVDGVQFVTGGFRTESLTAYLPTIMNAKVVFIGTGAADNSFTNLTTNKYFFRDEPINGTALGTSLFQYLAVLRGIMGSVIYSNLTAVHKWAVLRENLAWTTPVDKALNTTMAFLGYDPLPVADIAYDVSSASLATDFAGYWSRIQSAGAQVVIPIISAVGAKEMVDQYNATKPGAMIVGIDVPSQSDSFWNATNGHCRYEIVLQTLVRQNKTALTVPFYDHYKGNFSKAPVYTAPGSYDAITLFAYAINQTKGFNSDRIVTALEGVTPASPLVGSAGLVGFTTSHDLYYGFYPVWNNPTGTVIAAPVFAQWQAGGAKPCVTTLGHIYPDSWVTGSMSFPFGAGWLPNPP